MATFVMAFAIATSLTVVQQGIRALDTARNTTIAGQLLQSVMEDLRMLPWSVSGPGNSITGYKSVDDAEADPNGTLITLDNSFTNGDAAAIRMVARFAIRRKVTDVPGSSVLKRVQLTAQWRGIDNRSHTMTYMTYYGQNGLHDYYVK